MAKNKRGFGSIYRQKKRKPDGTVLELPTYWVKYSSKGRVFRESARTVNLAEAQRFLKRRLGEVVTGKFGGLTPERIRFCDLAEGVIHDYIDNERASLGHVKRRLKLHLLPTLAFSH